MRWRSRWLLLVALLFVGATRAAEVIPPAPQNHFNDYAGLIRADTARQLNAELTQYERDTTNQILVAIYPKMQTDSSVEDYTVRIAQAWKVGQADRKNGAVLFIFQQNRKVYVQVGYGLEGVLPDARCKQIIENEITPRFRQGDFEGGVRAGTRALLAAARGEYKGTGRTAADRHRKSGGSIGAIGLLIVMVVIGLLGRVMRRGTVYNHHGRSSTWITPGAGSWGGGSSGGSGGSFSGGGGGFGGGGAGGDW